MLMTYTEYGLAVNSSQIDQGHVPLSADDQRSWYVCWTPITWGDSPSAASVEDADDWKDVIFPAASQSEAEAIALHAFGVESGFEVELASWVGSADELSEENIDATVDELDRLLTA